MRTLVGDPINAIALFLSAVLVGASFQPRLWALSYAGLVIAAVVVERKYAKFVPALIAGFAFQLLGVVWTIDCYSTLQNTMQRTTDWLLLGGFFAGIWPVVFLAAKQLRANGWPLWLSLPVAWTIGDFSRYEAGRLITGGPYPWLTLGLSQADLVIPCQVADLGGVWAVGFIAAMFAATLVQSVVARRVPTAPVVILALAFAYGQLRASSSFDNGPTIALMPGVNESVPDVDLALWSETVFEEPIPLPTPAVLVQGVLRETGDRTFNSLAILQAGREYGMYDKCNLVPWSEFVPWSNRRLLSPGPRCKTFDMNGYRLGVAICYDICFSDFMRTLAADRPDFIVIAANEAADPSMMLAHALMAQSRLRAIEMRRTLIRNANGGYSGIIDGSGCQRLVETNFRDPIVCGSIPVDRRLSLYVILGFWLPIGCCLALAISIARGSRLHSVPDLRRDLVDQKIH